MTASVTTLPTAQPEQDGYSSPEIIALTGITYRQLDYWTRCRRIGRDLAPGSGNARRYTEADLHLIRAVAALLEVGFTVPAAFDVARVLTERSFWVRGVGPLDIAVIVREPPAAAGDPS